MNKKLLKPITLTLFLISSFGGIQNFLGINNTQALHAQGTPPPPPPPPPPMPGQGGIPPMPGQGGILKRAILIKIAKGEDLKTDKQKVIAELKDGTKAKGFFSLLTDSDNFDNIRQFLESNGFGVGTKTREAFEEKITEKAGSTPDTTSTPKKPLTHGGHKSAESSDIIIRNLIKYLKGQKKVADISDTTEIQSILELDLIKNLETQTYPITLEKVDYQKKDLSDVKEALEKRQEELEQETLVQEASKRRQTEIEKSIRQNVTQLETLSPDNLDNFVAAFTFPAPIQPNLTSEEKKDIINKSWLNYTGFQNKQPYDPKKKSFYYIIQFKIYDFDTKVFNKKFNTHAGTTNFDYYSTFFPGSTNLTKQFGTIKTELNKIIAAVNDIQIVLDFWGNLTLSINATDLAKQLPQVIINRLKDILTEAFLKDKINPTNKEEIKKIVKALFKDSEISDTLKTNLGIKKVIQIGGAKTPSEQIQNLQTKFSNITDISNLSVIQKAELSNIQKMSSLLTELQLTGKPTPEEIFNAIKAYKAPEAGTPDQHPQPGPKKTPPPMPARPLNQQLKTLKTNLTQLKGKLESLNTKLTALKVALH